MATMAFDSLQYARRLRAAGVPEPQAEVQAELMAEAFGFYASNIVTKDYLDEVLRARFAEQDARLEKRFAEIDKRFAQVNERFSEINERFAGVNERFTGLEGRMNQGFAEVHASMRQLTWMVGGTWLLVGYPLLLDLLDRLSQS
jgi:hypothetical protein